MKTPPLAAPDGVGLPWQHIQLSAFNTAQESRAQFSAFGVRAALDVNVNGK
jgi:hypothetical protein